MSAGNLKYDKDSIYSINNKLEVSIAQDGPRAMIREKGQDKATPRIGYRVRVSGETIAMGSWNETKEEVMSEAIKYERYAHLAYRELYYDLVRKLASIGLVIASDDDELDDRL